MSGTAGGAARRAGLETWLALVLALFGVLSVHQLGSQTFGADFYQFWAVGEASGRRELRDVYAAEETARLGRTLLQRAQAEAAARPSPESARRLEAAKARREIETYSTPFLYTVFGAAASGDYARDFERFQLASLVAHVLGPLAFARVLRMGWAIALMSVFLFTMAAGPFLDDVGVGNVNRLQVGALGMVAWLLAPRRGRWSDAAAGLVLALAVAFKPNLAFAAASLGLAWGATGRVARLASAAAGGAAGAALALLSSWAWFGSLAPWGAWLGKLGGLMQGWRTDLGNLSLARVLLDRFGIDVASGLAPLLLALVLAAWLALRFRTRGDARECGPRGDALALALGAAASVLSTKLGWTHYYLLIAPLALVLFASPSRIERALAVVLTVLTFTDLAAKVFPGFTPHLPLVIVLGALALFALGLAGVLRVGCETESDAAR
jgi:hypothetical protein